jgi:hypothetical protein
MGSPSQPNYMWSNPTTSPPSMARTHHPPSPVTYAMWGPLEDDRWPQNIKIFNLLPSYGGEWQQICHP